MNEVWSFEHSCECGVPSEFAWKFWTTVDNWALDSDVDSVTLDGEFASGSAGVTMSKSSGRIEWRIAEAEPGRAVLEFSAPGAVATFVWKFEDQNASTRITQRASFAGEQAAQYIPFGRTLEQGIPAGMLKLCAAMELAYSETHSARHSRGVAP